MPSDDVIWQLIATLLGDADNASRDAAVRGLEPLIKQAAERACRLAMVGKQMRQDFVQDAVAEILVLLRGRSDAPRIATYDPTTGSFAGWLAVVLDRLLANRRREQGRKVERETTAAKLSGTRGRPAVGAALDRKAPFGGRDLERILTWPVRDRVCLLAIAELWPKVPERLWAEWCREVGLSRGFPPADRGDRTLVKWITMLSDHTGESPAALTRRWYRKYRLLEQLAYLENLRYDK